LSIKPILFGGHAVRQIPIAAGYQRLYKNTELYALIMNQYKICIPDAGDEMMLFDIKTDPTESHDIKNDKPELFQNMKAKLEEIKESWRESREGKDYQW